jgi:hypothetical protein
LISRGRRARAFDPTATVVPATFVLQDGQVLATDRIRAFSPAEAGASSASRDRSSVDVDVARAEEAGLVFAFRARCVAVLVVGCAVLVLAPWPRNLYYLGFAAGFLLLGHVPFRLRRHQRAEAICNLSQPPKMPPASECRTATGRRGNPSGDATDATRSRQSGVGLFRPAPSRAQEAAAPLVAAHGCGEPRPDDPRCGGGGFVLSWAAGSVRVRDPRRGSPGNEREGF